MVRSTQWADNGRTVLYLEDGVVRAELSNAQKISSSCLIAYAIDWSARGSWPLAASHFPNWKQQPLELVMVDWNGTELLSELKTALKKLGVVLQSWETGQDMITVTLARQRLGHKQVEQKLFDGTEHSFTVTEEKLD